ncbi:peptidoglycan-binding protein [Streptomyces sp. NPDC098789]|uniref:peptidoglycan-binding domain-containing protein n=1 Tax=Streptomyces sp. NPDC098789 TaxID=3366098 RepID=UPI0038127BEB
MTLRKSDQAIFGIPGSTWARAALSWSETETEGAFGAATAEATRRFQQQRGLTPDGIVGADTWAQLRMGPF